MTDPVGQERYRWLKLAWKVRGVTPSQKLVLVYLADRAGPDGYCFVRVPVIAASTSLSERGVQYAVGHLEALGVLRRKPSWRDAAKKVHRRNDFFLWEMPLRALAESTQDEDEQTTS